MSETTLILLAAGSSTRFNHRVKKQWLRIGSDPLWLFVTKRLKNSGLFSNIVITAHPDEVIFMRMLCDETVVSGGESRQASLQNALNGVDTPYVMVTDVARSCVELATVAALLQKRKEGDVVVPALQAVDTIVYRNETIAREDVFQIQTPQLSKTAALQSALAAAQEFTDDSSAIVANGGKRVLIEGSFGAHKLTRQSDIRYLECLEPPSKQMRTGSGFDVHAFERGRTMFLCGVEIESEFGFQAHSDGDVAIHALIDALLGAAGLGDIGTLFPDSDEKYRDIDSKELLRECVEKLYAFGFAIGNVDITIMAQVPKLAPYKDAMRKTIAQILSIEKGDVNIKATTTEKLGFVGRKEGVGVMASANITYFDWTTL